MKRRSKVLLIISACITAAGVVICLVAAGIASSRGEKLFPGNVGDGNGYIYYFDSDNVSKIKIDVCDAKINVFGGADISRIEIINFNENLYSFSSSDAIISLKESENISSAFNIFDGGFDFKGLRYFFWTGSDSENKIVNVYIGKSTNVKAFDISADNGSINVSDMESETDYGFHLEQGSISLKNVNTSSNITEEIEKGDTANLSFDSVSAGKLSITASKAEIKAGTLSVFDCGISLNSGSVFVESYNITNNFYDINIATTGRINIGGSDYINSFVINHNPEFEEKDEYGQIKEGTLGGLHISANDAAITINELSEK